MRLCTFWKEDNSIKKFINWRSDLYGFALGRVYIGFVIKQKCESDMPKEEFEACKKKRMADKLSKRSFVVEYKSKNPCVDCGESEPCFLQFDHVKGNKKDSVSNMINKNSSLDSIMKEIDKCEIRCVKCHRARHEGIDLKTRQHNKF